MAKTKVLIIDGNPKSSYKHAEALKQLGYSVVGVASTTVEIYDLIQAKHPQIILHTVANVRHALQLETEIKTHFSIPTVLVVPGKNKPAIKRAKLKEYIDFIMSPYQSVELSAALEFAIYKQELLGKNTTQKLTSGPNVTQFQILSPIVSDLINNEDVHNSLNTILARAHQLLDVMYINVDLLDVPDTLVTYAATDGQPLKKGDTIHRSEGASLSWQAMDTKQPAISNGYSSWEFHRKNFDKLGIHEVMVVPIIHRDILLGAIDFVRTRADKPFTQADISIAQQFAQSIAMLLHNAELYDRLQFQIQQHDMVRKSVRDGEQHAKDLIEVEQRHVHELALLDKVRTAIADELELDILLKKVVESIADTFGYTHVSLHLLIESELVLQHQVGYEHIIERYPVTQGIGGRVINTGQAEFVKSVKNDPDFLGSVDEIASEICVPLFDKGKPMGVMNLESTYMDELTEADLKLMIVLGEYIGVAIGRARLFHDVENQNTYLKVLNDMTRAIMVSDDFDGILSSLVTDMAMLLHADSCHITAWDEQQQKAIPLATSLQAQQAFLQTTSSSEETTMTKSLIEAGHLLIAEDVFNSPYISPGTAERYPGKSILGIPLIFGRNRLGAVLIVFHETHHFTKREMEQAQQAGDQIVLALWNAQQEIELKKQLQKSETLAKIAVALSQTEHIGLQNVLQLIVNSAQELIPEAQQAVIHLLDDEREFLVPEAIAGFESSVEGRVKLRVGEGVAGKVILSNKTINISDVHVDSRFVKLSTEATYRSLMVTPLHNGEQALGTISIQSNIPNVFTPSEEVLLSELGTEAAIAIENAHLLESIQKSLKETSSLYQLIQRLATSLNPDEFLQETVELLQKNFGYYYVQVFLVDLHTGDFILHSGSGEIGAQLKAQGHRLAAGEGIVGYTVETGMPFFTNNVDGSIFHVHSPLLSNTKSQLAAPVRDQEKTLAIIDVHQLPPKTISPRDVQLISAVADQLAIAFQRADLYKDLQSSLEKEKAIRNEMVQQERLAIMGRLLATVSHELNNPIQAIQNALFLLKEEDGLSQQGKQDLNIVLAESERMASLIERLRSTYRPPQQTDFQYTNINYIIEDVYALISTHLRHNQVAFEFHPDPKLPVIQVLKDQIKQIILNLFMNAVEAMTDGGRLSVSTSFLNDTQEIWLCVADTGTGIDPEILPNIFNPFITNKEGGTGLGLTITYDIIKKHGGNITAENNPDQGATFNVWLPLKD